jgi:hypothetical protein
MKWILSGLGAAAVLCVVAAVGLYLTGPFGWKPPEVAPLSTGQSFHARLVLQDDEGYVVAGVAGTTQPDADDRCSGRFALVRLDEDGTSRRAVVASGPERDRFCASRVESVLPVGTGGWFLSGWGTRRERPPLISLEDPGTDEERYTLRFSADGRPDRGFGDLGLVRESLVLVRVGETLVTADLERMTDDGEVRDDLLAVAGDPFEPWAALVAEEDIVVALDRHGLPLTFRTFVVDRSREPARLGPSDAEPERSDRIVELGLGDFEASDAALDAGRLYVLVGRTEGHLFAVDPRRSRLVNAFGRDGRVVLAPNDLVTSAGLAMDRRGRPVVAFVTSDAAYRPRMDVRRFSTDGSLDRDFGGLVAEDRSLSDLDVTGILVDGAGRTLVLDAIGATVTRLTPAGRLDSSFGQDGVVSLTGLAVCRLPPARDGGPCRGR